MTSFIAYFLGAGIFGLLPWVLTIAALVDAVRTGADWYWYLIILSFPVVGALAYLVVVRSSLLGGRRQSMMSPFAARRFQAKRRLRELSVQLTNWRGPTILAEAGEELLALGKAKEAEKLLREALANRGEVEDVHFGLAQSLEMQGRWAEAIPYLKQLVAEQPDARLGQAQLHLARSLDENGDKAEAEVALRQVLARRSPIEAQVRLARLLQQRGEKEEAGRLVQEVLTDARNLPRYLKREHGAWIRAAHLLRTGVTRLPRPSFEGSYPPGFLLKRALWVVVLALVAFALFSYARGQAERLERVRQEAAREAGGGGDTDSRTNTD